MTHDVVDDVVRPASVAAAAEAVLTHRQTDRQTDRHIHVRCYGLLEKILREGPTPSLPTRIKTSLCKVNNYYCIASSFRTSAVRSLMLLLK